MGNSVTAIRNKFARSVRGFTTLHYESVRKRGTGQSCIRASFAIYSGSLFQTCGYDSPGQGCLCEDARALREALLSYRHLSLEDILTSRNEFIRAFGMLDARLSRQRLAKLNVGSYPFIAKETYRVRLAAEGMCDRRGMVVTAEEKLAAKAAREANLTDVLRFHKRKKNVSVFLDQVQDGTNLRSIDSKLARIMEKYVKGKNRALARPRYVQALKAIDENSKLVNEEYFKGLLELIRDEYAWVRSLDKWQHRTHNADRQFSSLARHLFANYDVPLFMDRAWSSGNRTHQLWFKHIGSGRNIRNAPDLPVPLTKMMAHHFLSASQDYTVERALRRAQALGLGADERMAAAIAESRLSDKFKDNEFWLSVIGFFARNPMLDCVYVVPIIDYIWNQKYEDVQVVVGRGVAENRGPAQPNFSMKGRTVAALLQQVERWHKDLGKGGDVVQWTRSSIAEFEFAEGSADKNNFRTWRVAELLSSKELVAEGRELQHCVASYANSCASGHYSIWSLTLQEQGLPKKLITIQVDLKRNVIVQVRGKQNRYPTAKEREIVQRWAAQVGLSEA